MVERLLALWLLPTTYRLEWNDLWHKAESGVGSSSQLEPFLDKDSPLDSRDERAAAAAKSQNLHTSTAFLHLVKGMIGPSILALPLQFARVGVPTGLVCITVVIFFVLRGIMHLVGVQQHVMKQAGDHLRPSFEELAEAVLGKVGKATVVFGVFSCQAGICAIFISMISVNLGPFLAWDSKITVAAVASACGLLGLMPNLESLWPCSLSGICCMLLTCFSGLFVAIRDPTPDALAPARDVSFNGVLHCITVGFFSFEGISLVLPIGNELRPQAFPKFSRTLFSAMGLSSLMYMLVGSVCGGAFPDLKQASLTADLAERFEEGTVVATWFRALNVLVSLAVLFTFPLMLAPSAQILEAGLGIERCRTRALARLLLVACCAALVLLVPSLDSLIGLIGAVATTVLEAIPYVMHASLKIRKDPATDVRPSIGHRVALGLAIDAVALVLYATVMVTGVSAALAEFIEAS